MRGKQMFVQPHTCTLPGGPRQALGGLRRTHAASARTRHTRGHCCRAVAADTVLRTMSENGEVAVLVVEGTQLVQEVGHVSTVCSFKSTARVLGLSYACLRLCPLPHSSSYSSALRHTITDAHGVTLRPGQHTTVLLARA